MSRLQALIWDVDGTLAETERDGHRVAFNTAFEALGVPWRWGEDAPLKKPDPQAYLRVLQQLGLRADEVIAIEDSAPGVAACGAAGVPVVVTRSVYFARADVAGALAVGPALDQPSAWLPQAAVGANPGRVGLGQLRAWFEAARPAD